MKIKLTLSLRIEWQVIILDQVLGSTCNNVKEEVVLLMTSHVRHRLVRDPIKFGLLLIFFQLESDFIIQKYIKNWSYI